MVDVVELQGDQLAAPHSGRVEHFQDRSITQSRGGAEVDETQQRFHFIERKVTRRQTMFFFRELQFLGRIGFQPAFVGEPAEPVLHGDQVTGLGSEFERLVGFCIAVMKQRAAVGLSCEA